MNIVTVKKNKNSLVLLELIEAERICLEALSKIHRESRTKGGKMSIVYAQKKQMQDLLYDVRDQYLKILTEVYGCEIPANFIKKNEHELRTISIMKILDSKKLIEKSFKKIMDDTIPAHPKDEYRAARAMHRRFILHVGATNTGKTYNAIQALKAAPTGVYLAPLRLLALEIFHTLNLDGVPCTLSTGEEDIIVPFSKHTSSTIEKLNLKETYDVAVIDEAQLINDSQRGAAWTRAILGVLAKEVHICCAPDAVTLITKIITDCKEKYEINQYERKVPLEIDTNRFEFPQNVSTGDALICFSKRNVLSVSSILVKNGLKVSVLYGNLPPDTRRKQMQMFIDGETSVVVTTDVIGMGLNLPVKRIVFMEQEKFDGVTFRPLNYSEVKQIAGRAGRFGKFDIGYVTSLVEKSIIRAKLEHEFEDITIAYTQPADEYILNLPIGTLRERLEAWQRRQYKIQYFNNADITQALFLLTTLETEFKKDNINITNIPIEQLYQYIFVPFDYKKNVLLNYWIKMVYCNLNNKRILFPEQENPSLDGMEDYYRLLDLHYAFCKELRVSVNSDEIMREKDIISDKIHKYLKENLQNLKKRCRVCKKDLPWDFPYNICTDCFYKKQYLNN